MADAWHPSTGLAEATTTAARPNGATHSVTTMDYYKIQHHIPQAHTQGAPNSTSMWPAPHRLRAPVPLGLNVWPTPLNTQHRSSRTEKEIRSIFLSLVEGQPAAALRTGAGLALSTLARAGFHPARLTVTSLMQQELKRAESNAHVKPTLCMYLSSSPFSIGKPHPATKKHVHARMPLSGWLSIG